MTIIPAQFAPAALQFAQAENAPFAAVQKLVGGALVGYNSLLAGLASTFPKTHPNSRVWVFDRWDTSVQPQHFALHHINARVYSTL